VAGFAKRDLIGAIINIDLKYHVLQIVHGKKPSRIDQ